MALLIPDGKCLVGQHDKFSLGTKNAAGYHLGPVAPSAADPAPSANKIVLMNPNCPLQKTSAKLRPTEEAQSN